MRFGLVAFLWPQTVCGAREQRASEVSARAQHYTFANWKKHVEKANVEHWEKVEKV